jgi:hypothetical protein
MLMDGMRRMLKEMCGRNGRNNMRWERGNKELARAGQCSENYSVF